MVSITVYMTPEQQEQLGRLVETTRVPMAVYIREGIDLALAAEDGRLEALKQQQFDFPKER